MNRILATVLIAFSSAFLIVAQPAISSDLRPSTESDSFQIATTYTVELLYNGVVVASNSYGTSAEAVAKYNDWHKFAVARREAGDGGYTTRIRIS